MLSYRSTHIGICSNFKYCVFSSFSLPLPIRLHFILPLVFLSLGRPTWRPVRSLLDLYLLFSKIRAQVTPASGADGLSHHRLFSNGVTTTTATTLTTITTTKNNNNNNNNNNTNDDQ